MNSFTTTKRNPVPCGAPCTPYCQVSKAGDAPQVLQRLGTGVADSRAVQIQIQGRQAAGPYECSERPGARRTEAPCLEDERVQRIVGLEDDVQELPEGRWRGAEDEVATAQGTPRGGADVAQGGGLQEVGDVPPHVVAQKQSHRGWGGC